MNYIASGCFCYDIMINENKILILVNVPVTKI